MLVSIEKELQKKVLKQKEKLKLDPIVEVENILNLDLKKEVGALTKISPYSKFVTNQNELNDLKVLESFEKRYDGNVFKLEHIKEIAIKYKLRFVNSVFYAGDFTSQVAPKLVFFCKKHKLKKEDLDDKFFILAPTEILHLAGDVKYNMNIDPLLFYKIDNEHYRLIHKWGNDFTMFRKLVGYKWKSFWNYWLTNTLTLFPVIFLLYYLYNSSISSSIFVSFGLSIVFSHIIWNRNKIEGSKIKESCFSPSNWNSCCNFKNT